MNIFTFSNVYDDERRTVTIAGKIKLPWPSPVCWLLHSSGARVFGRPVFGGKKTWWVMPTYRAFCRVSNAKYWVKYRMFPHRYHWVDTGLSPGYHDPDSLLLYSAFACLSRYIEEAGGIERLSGFSAELRDPEKQDPNDPGSEEYQADTQDEAVTLWKWWTEEKPRDEAERDRLMHILFSEDRTYTTPTENPKLVEINFKPFEGDDKALHKQFRDLEAKIDNDEQAMLHRLIDIRRSLWT